MKVVKSSTLKDAVIKSVLEEYSIVSKEISPEDFDYTGEVIEPPYDPLRLKRLRQVSGLHDICITTKCEDAIFSGKKIIHDHHRCKWGLQLMAYICYRRCKLLFVVAKYFILNLKR